MFSIIHYISAKRRLHESNKTVMMMGGEDECPPMLLAQRDMIQLETEYYLEEMENFLLYACYAALIVIFCGLVYMFINK